MTLNFNKVVYISLIFFLGLCACGRAPLIPENLPGNAVEGRAAWERLVKLESLQASAVLSWKSIDGSHGKYKVRLFLEPPEHLKIQWLTPWGSVAGQLIMVTDQFWFSDSRQRLTWHGLTADLKSLFQRQEHRSWVSAVQFFQYWPLFFTSPQEDDVNYGMQASINYLTTEEGRFLNKVINFKDGDEMHIRLDDLVPVADEGLLARNIEALGHDGQIALTLKKFTVQEKLEPETFIYNLKNFKIR
ncbi:MAG: hypothetical protein DRH03_06560 [Deltaproteobacteria bacterium]|nr:MAG: hypothetical protein DRH03_06560 [Deltaproteobacteria bacterium]